MYSKTHTAEISKRARFSYIRYSQCWEDTEVVLDALNIQEGETCVSIASAGDNSLALLTKNPAKVIALDINPAQLALVDLKKQAIKHLERDEVMDLFGYTDCDSEEKTLLYKVLIPFLSESTIEYFDHNIDLIEGRLCDAGKFEGYFRCFRNVILPLIHRKSTVEELVRKKSLSARKRFYNNKWNTLAWHTMVKVFFSNTIIGLFGRDPEFFKYVNRSLPEFLQSSIYNALVNQDPSENPYLHWILFGEFKTLPFWLQKDNYALIKQNIEKLELRQKSVEEFVDEENQESIDCWNLSDIFEYMSQTNYLNLLAKISRVSRDGARLAYWNMLVPRQALNSFGNDNQPKQTDSDKLYRRNKTFFYTRFILEIVEKQPLTTFEAVA